jgi:uncharacterized membrane protein YfcA
VNPAFSAPWVVTVLAAAFAGLARGFSGFGGALIFVPHASAAIGPRIAAPVLMVADTLLTASLVPGAWRQADRRDVAALSAGAVVGGPLGTALLVHLDARTLRWGMCGLALAMLALLASGWRYHRRPRMASSVLVGAVSGFCSGAAQMGGPPVVAYWLGGPMDAHRVRANILLFFAVTAAINGVAYLTAGLLNGEVFEFACIVGPAYALGLYGGHRCFGKTSQTAFRRICFLLIGAAALLGLPFWS